MLDFIKSQKEFLNEKSTMKKVFNTAKTLPLNLFSNSFSIFKAFEFDLVYDDKFFLGLQSFIRNIEDVSYTFYTLNPSPEEYYFRNFSKYNVVKVPTAANYNEYMNMLYKDPGGSPADSLIDNSRTILLFSNNPFWGVIGEKDEEIAIVGFKEKEILNLSAELSTPWLINSANRLL